MNTPLPTPFVPWNDDGQYFLMSGGDFEGDLSDWTLENGASTHALELLRWIRPVERHIPKVDAADKLSRLVSAAESVPRLRPVSGHARDTVAGSDEPQHDESGSVAELSKWARQDSNLGHTDYESAALTS